METKNFKIVSVIERKGNTVYALLQFPGFVGRFRFGFIDKTRKNGDLSLDAMTVTYSPVLPEDGNYSTFWQISEITDAMLFVERHKQWILEKMIRDFELYFTVSEMSRR